MANTLTVRVDQLQVGDVLVPTERRVERVGYSSKPGKLLVELSSKLLSAGTITTGHAFGKSTTVTIRREAK
ncbi:MAG: hypothetical protein ABL982_00185 [Vicinamibacterales bacterium]